MKKKKRKGINAALIFVAVFDLIFTAIMIWLFYLYQSTPDALIVAVFAATLGETSATTIIYKAQIAKEEWTKETEESRNDS